ncbi:MAG: hypothetical protein A3J65_01810 [Candidatus Buchananbacteria bacterium RIFCSPHIGHO2_02_FULL_45_11b]|uniref:HTH cro/C1-type domain-containing protein n=3 Tax=Candidatus Buchananiibacteriota TaxID=1817903 RepID=A0A1G1Y7B1_9BACT|nr:MAG: hypothetical protein A2663_03210 [Candidatus Buchananbacteria bacterium RIFCSPHIGHO2_01_FULL_46_12]OGY50675.1 MAG: hypothetical protein A3J65_01810 [Candidatus Buchananbacteria bacterium RIFCSPHIGHO2_02_FULL_45_11b]OGY58120.1 MAG: hypothetical protein A3H67_03400 [Candidatus Buchananbacteria bacterium RIFCSPLOWO2_02_FULL_46_11b]
MLNSQKLAKKVRKIREDMEISQGELAERIGLSRVALSQLEIGKRGIDALELAAIAEALGISVDFLLHEEKDEKPRKSAAIKLNFSEEKLKNLILYILNKCGGKPNVGETVLYKLLYFVDFDCFEITGKPLTGMSYIKMQFGPVPKAAQFNQAVGEMIKNKEIEIISSNYFGKVQKRYISWKKYDVASFKSEELEIINAVINQLSDLTASQIEDYVHGDAPWKIADDQEEIDYNLVFERSAPYAHRNYEGLWREASAKDALKALGPMSDEEYNYYQNL